MRVLIVEDEHKIANSIKKGLEHENYAVDVVYNGKDGLDYATTEEYDLIILDLLLPEIDGVDICKNLRKEGIHTPVLILTAKGQIDDKVVGLDSGADDYMVKPFAFSELFARVRALLRRPKNNSGLVLKVDNLTLDPSSFEVKKDKKTIHLSAKEFALLEYLMRHPDQIITKEQIINHVWDYDSDVMPNSVEVYIKHLRDKIDLPFKAQLIKTVRGFGYSIGVK